MTDQDKHQPSSSTIQLLSEVIRGINTEELTAIFDDFDDAIRNGKVMAVEHATAMIRRKVTINGEEKTLEMRDQMILDNDAFAEWLTDMRRKSRYMAMVAGAPIRTTPERLQNGDDNFEALAGLRRKRLREQAKRAKRPKAPDLFD